MDKKKIVIGITICFVLLIILSILISFEKKTQLKGHVDGTTVEGQLLLSGMSIFSESYNGDIKTKEITQKMQQVIKTDIPELYESIKKLDEKKLRKYYNDENTMIKNKFGIQTEEEFIDFSNKISKTKIDLNTWHKIKINRESFLEKSEKTNYAYVEFDVVFKNEEKMSFSLYIANRQIMSPQYIFSAK